MNTLISTMIQSSNGYYLETAGVVIAFFEDGEQARKCAKNITLTIGKKAEVCGTQLSLPL